MNARGHNLTDRSDEQTLRQRELENCSFCKAVLMLLVLFYHAISPWIFRWPSFATKYDAPKLLTYIGLWLNTFHIYGFALFSGYIYAFSKLEKRKYKEFGSFIKVKARRLLVPLVFVSAFWAVPIDVIVQHYGWKELFNDYILLRQPAQLWFIVMLFGVFAVFDLLSDFFASHDAFGFIIVIVFYGFEAVCNRFLDNYFQIWSICRYVLFFWIGFKIRQKGSGILRKIPAWAYIIADIALFAVIQLPFPDKFIWQTVRSGLNVILFALGAVMSFVVLQSIADRINWKESKIMAVFIKFSMPVYLLHQQVIYILSSVLVREINPCIRTAIIFVLALLISLALSSLLFKIKPTRKMLGEST